MQTAEVTISFSAACANLAKTMDRVCEDHEGIIITRNGKPSVVMLSLDDFRAQEEPAYLMGSTTNATRLLSAMEQLSEDRDTTRDVDK